LKESCFAVNEVYFVPVTRFYLLQVIMKFTLYLWRGSTCCRW